MKKVLIVGGGGREHALGWSLAQDSNIEVIYAPGNAGTAQEEKGRNVSLDGSKKENFEAVHDLVRSENIDMVIVGPEQPLTEGLVDYLNSKGFFRVFGSTKAASQLESDKFFSYDLMQELGVPQANSIKCYTTDEAIRAINGHVTEGIVIKARGLTGGKGVTVCDSKEKALNEIKQHAEKYGPEVLIAERLFGQEFSVFGISDGNKVYPLEISVQDHKPLLDGDKGPNTGGMGAYCPALIADASVVRNIAENIMTPIVQRMKEMGIEYKGFLYAGMIMTEQGPKVIEFNIRMGDPEAQPLMMMVKGDLYEYLSLAIDGKLNEINMDFNPGAACCVVLASQGYPGAYQKGLLISGLEEASKMEGVKVFHAGTKSDNGQILATGGRVLGVTGYSPNGIAEAQKLAYAAASKINIPGGFHYRKDIANKSLK